MAPLRESKQDDLEGSKGRGKRDGKVPQLGSLLKAVTGCDHKMLDERKDRNGICSNAGPLSLLIHPIP